MTRSKNPNHRRLATLKPSVQTLATLAPPGIGTLTTKRQRLTGRALQRRNDRIKLRDRYTCQLCQALLPPSELQIDHIVSLLEGGSDDDSNLRSLCIDCHKATTRALLSPGGRFRTSG